MRHFTEEQLKKIDLSKTPRHIAVIPDGNRRWALNKKLSPSEGHEFGCDAVTNLVNAAKELKIQVVTLYSFSTENWKRPKEEIQALMNLLVSYLKDQTPRMISDGIQLNTIGDLSPLSREVKEQIEQSKTATKDCSSIRFVIALNYGGRDEIRRAIGKILDDYDAQKIQKQQLTESLISQYLDTAAWGDPDLFIRTSGEKRISNFLLWQISYTEIYTTPVYWPDFTSDHLLEAIASFQERQKRIGS